MFCNTSRPIWHLPGEPWPSLVGRRTQAGHRRITAAEVEHIQQGMQTSRRAALAQLNELTSDLVLRPAQQLNAAGTKAHDGRKLMAAAFVPSRQ